MKNKISYSILLLCMLFAVKTIIAQCPSGVEIHSGPNLQGCINNDPIQTDKSGSYYTNLCEGQYHIIIMGDPSVKHGTYDIYIYPTSDYYIVIDNMVDENCPENRPKLELSQNYPNPFNPYTEISYQIEKESFVRLVVYNVIGYEIKVLVNEAKKPGEYSVRFDASSLPSGIYFYRIEAGPFTETKKMLLIK